MVSADTLLSVFWMRLTQIAANQEVAAIDPEGKVLSLIALEVGFADRPSASVNLPIRPKVLRGQIAQKDIERATLAALAQKYVDRPVSPGLQPQPAQLSLL